MFASAGARTQCLNCEPGTHQNIRGGTDLRHVDAPGAEGKRFVGEPAIVILIKAQLQRRLPARDGGISVFFGILDKSEIERLLHRKKNCSLNPNRSNSLQ